MTGRRSLPIVPSSPVARNSEALRIDRRSDPAQREAWTPFDASAEYTSESHARSASEQLFSFDDNSHKKVKSFAAAHSRAGRMGLMRQRDMQHHTYADYLTWSATYGNEVIDGIA